MPKQTIGVRVSDELLQAIDERCKTSRLSRSELLLNLIQQGLSLRSVNDKEAGFLSELPKKLNSWGTR